MAKFIVEGPTKLHGAIDPIGNKNSVLKLIPTALLFKGDYVLTNVPAISDVQVMLDILVAMGATVNYDKEAGRAVINTDGVHTSDIPFELANKVRASVLFFGPLLVRFGRVQGNFPGGDKIGARELKAHFAGFVQMGAQFSGDEWGAFTLSGPVHAAEIMLYEPSVTATENLILAAAGTSGTTKIVGAACEPHIQEMCEWLQECGVVIDGIGSNVLYITGVQAGDGRAALETQGKEHAIWPDHLDVGTNIVAAAITGSELLIRNVRHKDLLTINFFYEQLGVRTIAQGNDLLVPADQEMAVQDPVWARTKGIYSQPWYSFPTDLMSMTITLGMFVKGSTLFFEKMYSDRMSFANAFNAAGANIFICDYHRIVVTGPSKLKGFRYQAPDIRAGMAYFLAALAADGKSEIEGAEHIDRGYPNTPERYSALGANVIRA